MKTDSTAWPSQTDVLKARRESYSNLQRVQIALLLIAKIETAMLLKDEKTFTNCSGTGVMFITKWLMDALPAEVNNHGSLKPESPFAALLATDIG
jgi:hypothetical protein